MNNNVDPTREQFDQFKTLPRDTPIMMLNLVRLNKHANYEDGRSATAEEAYASYGRESEPIFRALGGEIIWRGKPEAILIGPSTESWDIAFIARYPDAGAFMAMVTNPEYQSIVFHRQAAVEDSRLIRMGELPQGSGFAS